MAAFLEQLAKALLREHGHALGNVAVVLPSQRAGLYLRDALARQAGRALWSPEMFTLSSFMERLSGLRALPMEELLFEAYEAYRNVGGTEARVFDDFIEWAPVTLADMSEADANMVRLDGFYRDLRSWEELDWSFNVDPLSDGQQRMVRYWALAGRLHLALNERLLAQNAGTSGLVERRAAERGSSAFVWERIWFAGLNAFTTAEQRVIDSAHDAGLARFAWDGDEYYLTSPEQEAGEHLRAAIKRYGPGALPIGSMLREEGPRIQVMRAPNPVAQVWCAADHLRSLSPEERAHTSIVLADEGLLPALLEALPSDSGAVNVTMGLSLASLPVGALLDAFFRGHASGQGAGTWSIGDVEQVLRHPFLRLDGADGVVEEALSELISTRLPRIGQQDIIEALAAADEGIRTYARAIFDTGPECSMRDRIMALLAWAKHAMTDDTFATEQIYQTSIVWSKTAGLLERYGHASVGTAWIPVMTRLLRAARIGLFGEPLTGLQVMGLLEARGLDPRRIILLGAQEGKLPTASIERSYIPFELRRAYGLPLRDSSDAVQAYNFLRLLQRAEDVMLVYAEDGAASGPSRYIAQLRHELYHDRPDGITSTDARVPVPARIPRELVRPNDEDTILKVRALLEKGLSPTMLRAWLRCPLDFWFRYVLGLREPDSPGARIGGDVLGNVLHGVLEDIHRPWLGRPIVAAEVEAAIPEFGNGLRDRLSLEVSPDRLKNGQPLLQVGMAVRAAENFLRGEARSVRDGVRIVPLSLEEELRMGLFHADLPPPASVVIKGRLDRVDERDGLIHVFDLKTGRVDASALRIKELTIDALKGDRGYAAQLLVYAWLYLSIHEEVPEVRTGLQPLQRASGSEGLYLRIGDTERITRADLPAITDLLREVVATLLDPAATYAHHPDSTYCVFCAHNG